MVNNAMAKLYAFNINKRKITILDVPEEYRETVMSLLNDNDRMRMQTLMESEQETNQ